MTQVSTLQFAHRINDDGTIDSICCDCFVTIATESWESDLERNERDHTCHPDLVEHYKKAWVECKFYSESLRRRASASYVASLLSRLGA